ncbi:hypothetical protein ACHQM5_023433 [Ranunculus cassubicifolius]
MKEEKSPSPSPSSTTTVSDEELINHLREFLKNSDLNTTTTAIVRRKLEQDFAVDLTDRKGFIRQQVDLFLQTQLEKPADDDVEEVEELKPKVKSEKSDSESEEEEEVSSGEEISSNGKGRKKAVVKQIWKYIQARDLQDPSNRKNIRCDEALRAVFKVDIIGMLQMNKALTRHIWPLGSDENFYSHNLLHVSFNLCKHFIP